MVHIVMTPVFIFQDEGTWFLYSPALDLTGYGETQSKAEESFNVALAELVKYAKNKGTIKKMLVDMGWTFESLSKKHFKLTAPSLHELLRRDEYLREIFDTKEFYKINRQVELPPLAVA